MYTRAKVVIAIHGAGLSNMIYSEVNTTIIEIHCSEFRNLCLKNQAFITGMFHYGLYAKPSGSNQCLHLIYDLETVLNVTQKAIQL
jgi:capsular polysaccharide biosynthesis protein